MRGRGLPHNVVRSAHGQSKQARQESPAAVTSVPDITTSNPLPPTTSNVITSDPVVITSVPDITTTDPLPPTTSNVIITAEPTTVAGPQSFRREVRQGVVTVLRPAVATPIEFFSAKSPEANPTAPTATFAAPSPTAEPATPSAAIVENISTI
ncbi:hypothetical protein diail_5207 [Diaporthe ilicicola]|nr:hypothetical protein diail_5207 [Diaporthe ilicicola]